MRCLTVFGQPDSSNGMFYDADMKVLYIGGTGQISFDCVNASVRQGHATWVFNRGNSNAGLDPAVRFITGDMYVDADYQQILDEGFDVICQFRVFDTDAMERDLRFFSGHVDQYVFISTASAYQKPVRTTPITEDVPLVNPHWEYSRKKADCEALLQRQQKLPWTIVRPSHTSRDKLTTAMGEGDLAARRMLAGKPVIVPGDGTSLWTITDSKDFAPPFVKLLGNEKAIGEAFHLTSDRAFSWNQIYESIAEALGVEAKIVHVPTATLINYRPQWEGPLWGDKSWTVIFDNSKIRSVVGDFNGNLNLLDFMSERVRLFRESGGEQQQDNAELVEVYDRICEDQSRLGE
jgi:nucleoside-diphosphate-sugar epimerase